jgi:hypothetical protein
MTVAPITRSLKPQVFPCVAASFIMNSRSIAERSAACTDASGENSARECAQRRHAHRSYAHSNWPSGAFHRSVTLVLCTRLQRTRVSARDQMTLLILTAGVLRRFRFAWTVTILQHDNGRLVTSFRSLVRQGVTELISLRESPVFRIAEELGKSWRFFTTYGDVQIGSVLRQSFLAPVIANVGSNTQSSL